MNLQSATPFLEPIHASPSIGPQAFLVRFVVFRPPAAHVRMPARPSFAATGECPLGSWRAAFVFVGWRRAGALLPVIRAVCKPVPERLELVGLGPVQVRSLEPELARADADAIYRCLCFASKLSKR